MLVGNEVRSYDAGEVWHLFDQRYDMTLTMAPIERLGSIQLGKYNTMILVDGNYGKVGSKDKENIQQWIKSGGNVIAFKKAAKWLSDNAIGKAKFTKLESDSTRQRTYKDLGLNYGAQVIGGAIFQATIDQTHPLGYGYTDNQISIFKNSTLFHQVPKNPYAYPIRFTNKPLSSGYISEENLEKLSDSPAVVITSWGSGQIYSFTENHNFRAFWYGTNKYFINAVFFGGIIDTRSAK